MGRPKGSKNTHPRYHAPPKPKLGRPPKKKSYRKIIKMDGRKKNNPIYKSAEEQYAIKGYGVDYEGFVDYATSVKKELEISLDGMEELRQEYLLSAKKCAENNSPDECMGFLKKASDIYNDECFIDSQIVNISCEGVKDIDAFTFVRQNQVQAQKESQFYFDDARKSIMKLVSRKIEDMPPEDAVEYYEMIAKQLRRSETANSLFIFLTDILQRRYVYE